jgi:hypothetical protein
MIGLHKTHFNQNNRTHNMKKFLNDFLSFLYKQLIAPERETFRIHPLIVLKVNRHEKFANNIVLGFIC